MKKNEKKILLKKKRLKIKNEFSSKEEKLF